MMFCADNGPSVLSEANGAWKHAHYSKATKAERLLVKLRSVVSPRIRMSIQTQLTSSSCDSARLFFGGICSRFGPILERFADPAVVPVRLAKALPA
jgi:hypothetical protein